MQFHHYISMLQFILQCIACDKFNEKCAYHKIRLILQVFSFFCSLYEYISLIHGSCIKDWRTMEIEARQG